MDSTVLVQSKNSSGSASLLLRLVLYKGELFHLPQLCQEIRILSGCAWLTRAGRDIILPRGETISFRMNKDFALISALGKTPLVFEVWTANCSAPSQSFYLKEIIDHANRSRTTANDC